MPKLVHKTKVTRLKNYNYSKNRDKLEKIVIEGVKGKTKLKSPSQIVRVAELPQNGRNVETARDIVRKAIPIEDRTDTIKKIMKEGREHNQLAAVDLANRMDGIYNEQPQRMDMTGGNQPIIIGLFTGGLNKIKKVTNAKEEENG